MNTSDVRWSCVLAFALASCSIAGADDLAKLQGKWTTSYVDRDGSYQIVRTVDGETETANVFLNDKLVQESIADIKIEAAGPAKMYAWSNGRILRRNGDAKLPDGRRLYRVESDKWTLVDGLLEGDLDPVSIAVYRRVAPPISSLSH